MPPNGLLYSKQDTNLCDAGLHILESCTSLVNKNNDTSKKRLQNICALESSRLCGEVSQRVLRATIRVVRGHGITNQEEAD